MAARKKILIIDDDEKISRMYSRRLSKLDLEVTMVNNGEEGIEKAFEILPDLIILDIHMPGMGGLEVIRLLRKKEYKGMVVACSASVTAMDTHKTIDAGCNDFIQKPIDLDFEQRILSYFK
jgi:CheY-like chemotaxis protein